MGNQRTLTIIATLFLLTGVSAQAQRPQMPPHQDVKAQRVATQADSLASILERCWRAEEIGSSRNADFQQDVGLFRGEVRLHWCRTTLEARGPVERRGKRNYLARIDSLTLHLRTDSITAELRERAGEPARLIVNGHVVPADWWRAGSRERVLRLTRIPLL
jgi:hypothetical protein